MYSHKALFRSSEIRLIDPDKVEDQNLARQNFFAYDRGKNKARVLASRMVYDHQVKHIPMAFNNSTSEEILNDVAPSKEGFIVMIVPTDNFEARRHTLEALTTGGYTNYLWLSPGCKGDDGQVIVHLVLNGEELTISPLITHSEIGQAPGEGMDCTGSAHNCGATPGSTQTFISNFKAALVTCEVLSALLEQNKLIPGIFFTKESFEYLPGVVVGDSL
jgi:molybdopterin/thiamine biosynthesis adenylyltransferase